MNENKKLTCKGYGITAFVFLVLTLWLMGVFGSYTGDELGVWLLCLYIIMPITSLVVGILLGNKGTFMKWFYPIIVGVYGVFIPYFTSVRFNSSAKFYFEVVELFFAFIPALLGVFIGILIRKVRAGKQATKGEH